MDYKFGEYILKLRKEANLSQANLAKMLGVTNKAVSKWETGKCKPNIDVLRKMTNIFNVSIDELLLMPITRKEKTILKIVITGGPCAGKSTAMSHIQKVFSKKGYKVLFIPETATELITGGVAPWTCRTNVDFQRNLIYLQQEKEKTFISAASTMIEDKILIVCDRGTIDSKAFISSVDFKNTLKSMNTNEVEMRDSYDAVFHLVTAAKGAKEFYTLANNSARTETIEEAIDLDDKLIAAWTGHPHLRIVDNSTDFDSKIRKLISEISLFLGEPEPFEIERKFLIKYPDLDWLNKLKNCQKVEIIQTYLKSNNDDEVRIRQRGSDEGFVYYKTTKRKIDTLKRIEIEKRLSKDEYLRLLMDADPAKKPIRKTRYCIMYKNQYFELDIYPFWDDKAILEIELNNEEDRIVFPKKIDIIKEVTNDDKYKNISLATINNK